MVDQVCAHDRCARRNQRGLGELLGFAHIRTLIIAAAVACAALSVEGHEIGTTQVNVVFHKDHTYTIDVMAASLARANIERATAAVDARFNDRRVTPAVEMQPGATSMHLHGDIPQNAKTFTFAYGLSYSTYALTLRNEGHGEQRVWIEGMMRSAPFPLASDIIPPTRLDVARQYLLLGFTHIIPFGLDHILFVIGIFLLTTNLRAVLLQVTAFTIAHSITLGLTMYGIVSLSPRIVEPMIAVSITFIAIENIVTSELRPWRIAVVFGFGLLHGMGFAGVLKELGLPRSQFVTALLSFNIGVELGQLAVIATVLLLFAYWHRAKAWYRPRFVVPASLVIAATGIVWTIQRVFA